MSKDNLKLWNAVEKTDPNHTKNANVKGNKITSIKPQYQILQATKQWGAYGGNWGLKDISYDTQLVELNGLIVFKANFYAPTIEFPLINTISVWRDGAMTKPDDEWAKKVETDTLTKALSKLGFNADIFMGRFDDLRYVEEMKKEFAPPVKPKVKGRVSDLSKVESFLSKDRSGALKALMDNYSISKEEVKVLKLTKEEIKNLTIID